MLDDVARQDGQTLEILLAAEAVGLNATMIEALAIVRNMFVGVRQDSPQLLVLPLPHSRGVPPLALSSSARNSGKRSP